jgi:UDP-N-acetylmuramyl pentapeptide phosphotransferase/UDP-N-acetylglucosamine-1-phosphate transferase
LLTTHSPKLLSLIAYTFITAFVLSFVTLPIIITLLTRMQIMDVGGRRKIHKGFVPRMGGAAIFIGFIIAIVFWIPYSYWAPYKFLLFASALIFFTGMRDDIVELSPRMKLIMQFMAIFMIIWNGGNDASSIRISSFYGFCGIHDLPMWASYFVTTFVIVTITNAFNLIDGLDGLAGTLGLTTFTLLAVWFLSVSSVDNNSAVLGLFSVAIIGGILAFLCFNWHPASIFMGDTGSLFLGFFLSVCVIKFLGINGNPNFVSDLKINAPISMALAISIIPLLDTGRVFIMRISQHRSPFTPDKLHIHHLLMRMGLSHPKVVFVMSGLYMCFVCMIVMLSFYFGDNVLVPFIMVVCVGLHFVLRSVVYFVFDRKHQRLQKTLGVNSNT